MFLVDDKGLVFLLVFGLPPLVHVDDPARAVRTCNSMLKILAKLKLQGRFGVTTGRVFCGVVGSDSRREYTTMGDTVNLSARLMANAEVDSVLADEATYKRCKEDIFFEKLESIKVKGKTNLIPIFRPVFGTATAAHIMSTNVLLAFSGNKIARIPWKARSSLFNGGCRLVQIKAWEPYQQLKTAFSGEDGMGHKGGVLVVTGQSANGKDDLCEASIHFCIKAKMVPLCTTFYDASFHKPLEHLVETALYMLDKSGSFDGTGAPRDGLIKVLNETVGKLSWEERCWLESLGYDVSQAVSTTGKNEKGQSLHVNQLETVAAVFICRLLNKLLENHPTTVLLRWRRGTSIYSVDQSSFWRIVSQIAELAKKAGKTNPLLLIVVAREFDPKKTNLSKPYTEIIAQPLDSAATEEYAKFCLDLPATAEIPRSLFEFLQAVSLNVPLYIQEMLD